MTRKQLFLVAAVLGCPLAAPLAREGARGAPPQAGPGPGLVVHEWGTFSTFSGSDGTYRKFYPDDRDLPGFVHSRLRHIKGGLPDVYLSLETPVLYFYTGRALTG